MVFHDPFDSTEHKPIVVRGPESVAWLVCNGKRGLFALRSLAHLELHLQVRTPGWADRDSLRRRASIDSVFELFENLRLLPLKKAAVIISYRGKPWEAGPHLPSLLSNGELSFLAESFTQRLLNADQSSGAFLAEKLSKMGKSTREAESDPVLEKEHKLNAFNMLADQDGIPASKMRQSLTVAYSRHFYAGREKALLKKMTGQKIENPKVEDIWTTDLIDLYDGLNI